jgi:hypothetical protein
MPPIDANTRRDRRRASQHCGSADAVREQVANCRRSPRVVPAMLQFVEQLLPELAVAVA